MSTIRNWIEHNNRIIGLVYGDVRYTDGSVIMTSPVVERNDNVVTTRSGSQYELIQ